MSGSSSRMNIVGLRGCDMLSNPRSGLPRAVSNVGSSNPENNIFGNVCGMSGYPVQVSRDLKGVQRLFGNVRLGLDANWEVFKFLFVYAGDFFLRLENAAC